MSSVPAVQFYDVVVALHVMSVVAAFGVILAYPVMATYFQRTRPEALAAFHGLQARLTRTVVTWGGTLVLATGVYLASDRDLWSETWVTVPLVIIVVVLGLAGAFFGPRERELEQIAARDGGPSADYRARFAILNRVGGLTALLILVAIFFMVAKPFA